MNGRTRWALVLCVVGSLGTAAAAAAQLSGPARDQAEPDLTIINLSTTGQIRPGKFVFRMTHRFSRPLDGFDNDFSFGELLDHFFGFDSASQIGLELRVGLMTGTHIGIHRTNERTIAIFGQRKLARQGGRNPVGIDAVVSVEGLDNFREQYVTSVGVVVSRRVAQRLAVYVQPLWVANTNPLPSELTDENHTFQVGLSSRLRVRPTIYLVGEFMPRAGYTPGTNHASFGIEKRAGGHMFQLNFSNGLGSTIGQLARAGNSRNDWFIGFNITRKFF